MGIHNWFSDGLNLKGLKSWGLAVSGVVVVHSKWWQNSHLKYSPVVIWIQMSMKDRALNKLKKQFRRNKTYNIYDASWLFVWEQEQV